MIKVEYTDESSMMDSIVDEMSPSQTHSPSQQRLGSFDVESGFEPQTRARSNTWPLPRPEGYVDGNNIIGDGSTGGGMNIGKDGIDCNNTSSQPGTIGQSGGGIAALLPVKKNSSRRNAWGNLSYADLITQAITSAADNRLTLSQIYEWMVHNVPYFKDKGDSNSSAGWKNSIRHNLSLHNRFMRVQNEGTGKSSWWMINPDAKPGKSARRRATSMETSKFEKRRGRVKKKVEALRNNGGLQADATPSPSSSISEGLDLFPDSPLHTASSFQLSPDFRPRASSNASSVGRLSPIPSVYSELDWTSNYVTNYNLEKLAGNLDETMKLEPYQIFQTSPTTHQQQAVPPPSYYDTQYQRSNSLHTTSSYGLPPTSQPAAQPRCSIQMNSSPVSGMSPTYQQNETNASTLSGVMSPSQQSHSPQQQQQTSQPSSQSSKLVHIKQEIIDDQETEQQNHQQHSPQPQQPQQQQQQQQPQQQQQQQQRQHQPLHYFVNCRQLQQHRNNQLGPENSSPPETPTDTASTMMGQLMGALNNSTLLDDLNINIEGLSGGFDCNVDEVIKHELSMDGTLDFNFQNSLIDSSTIQVNNTDITQNNIMSNNPVVNTVAANSNTGVYVTSNSSTPTVPPSWVH